MLATAFKGLPLTSSSSLLGGRPCQAGTTYRPLPLQRSAVCPSIEAAHKKGGGSTKNGRCGPAACTLGSPLSRQPCKGCALVTDHHSRPVPSETLDLPLDDQAAALTLPLLQGFQLTEERVQGLWRTAHPGWSYYLQTAGNKGGLQSCFKSLVLSDHWGWRKTRQVQVDSDNDTDSAPNRAVACWGWCGHGQGLYTICETAWRRRLPGVKIHPQGVGFPPAFIVCDCHDPCLMHPSQQRRLAHAEGFYHSISSKNFSLMCSHWYLQSSDGSHVLSLVDASHASRYTPDLTHVTLCGRCMWWRRVIM